MTVHCAVLGDPIEHSLSPVLHRAGYAAVGLDWSYDAHRVASGGLGAFLGSLDGSWRGLSLTMPLKREAMALVDEASETAELAGGANTLLLGERPPDSGMYWGWWSVSDYDCLLATANTVYLNSPTTSGSPWPYQASMLISVTSAQARLTNGAASGTAAPNFRTSRREAFRILVMRSPFLAGVPGGSLPITHVADVSGLAPVCVLAA